MRETPKWLRIPPRLRSKLQLIYQHRTRSAPNIDAVKPHLLSLPGEIRNRIYSFALIDHESTIISTTVFEEPSLLATCKQVRREAAPIFYAENKFGIHTQDHNSDPLMIYNQKVNAVYRTYGVLMRQGNVSRSHRPNWSNLHTMLYRLHKFGPWHDRENNPEHPTCPERKTIATMFMLVSELHDLPWARVDRLVEDKHRVLIACDPQWQ